MSTATSETATLQEQLDFFGLDAQAQALLRGLKPVIAGALDGALTDFYGKVQHAGLAAKHFRDDQHIAAAKSRQSEHWNAIASGQFDNAFAARARAVGLAHARAQLEPRWYIGGYAVLVEALTKAVLKHLWKPGLFKSTSADSAAEAVAVVIRASLLDLDLALSVYMEEMLARSHESETALKAAEEHQNTALASLGSGLTELAGGNMDVRINEALAPSFDAIKNDFNAAVNNLQEALVSVASTTSEIHAGSSEISTATSNLAERTERQAASLDVTAAALEEITVTVKKTAEATTHAQEVVTTAAEDAGKGGDVVKRAIDAMAKIETSSEQIGRIIGVIDEIAFQTNLLALNAGVEAARAGEAGRGFAVVASEVRALAQRSAEAAKEIKDLISVSTAQVEQGVSLVNETGAALERIVERVGVISKVMRDIAASAKEQAVGLQEVNNAVGEMDQVTQQNAAMVEQTTAASHSLQEHADKLAELMTHFRLGNASVRRRRQPTTTNSAASRTMATSKSRPPRKATRAAAAPQAAAARAPDNSPDDWEEF